MKDKSISYARKRLERQIEIQEKEHKRKLQATRIELARAGISAYQRRRFSEAVKNFTQYIRVVEEMKECGEGRLSPSHFDIKKDQNEILMISGIYWDLAKLYDRTKSKARYVEFSHYLKKYVEFSKGMPFQHLCAEALRKYLSGDGAVHREDFKNAYRILGTQQCFVVSSLSDQVAPQTLSIFRDFRDEVLSQFVLGRAFTRWYYRNGLELSFWVDRFPQKLRFLLGQTLDFLARRIHKRNS